MSDLRYYTTTIDLRGLRVELIDEVEELLRTVGTPALHLSETKAVLTMDVGPGGVAEDMWDLRELCEELEANLSGYVYNTGVSKPVEIKG